jgi:hypothetical protein
VIPNGLIIPPIGRMLSYTPAFEYFDYFFEVMVFIPVIFHPTQELIDSGIKHIDMTVTIHPHENWDDSAITATFELWYSDRDYRAKWQEILG